MELNKENLYQMYIVENKSRQDCAKIFQCSESLIKKRLHLYEIKKDKQLVNKLRNKNVFNRYGVNSISQVKEISQKISKTKKDWNQEQKDKMVNSLKNTMNKKYGVNNASYLNTNYFKNINEQDFEIMHNKSVKTFKERYNYDIYKKRKETCLKKYGAKTFAESKYYKDYILRNNPNYNIISNKNLLKEKILEMGKPSINDLCNELGYSYSPIFKAIKQFQLEKFVKKSYSRINVYWHDLILKNIGIDLKYEGSIFNNNYDKVDLYSEEKKIAIDINPTVTHNTQFNPFHPQGKSHISTTYHFNRAKIAEENGWFLYQIFDWDDEVKVLRQLKSLFGINDRVYARNCELKVVNKIEANLFFDKWHSQCRAESMINYGLYYNNNLISVMSFGRARFNKNAQYELIRYAGSDVNVVGGASKLLKAFIKDYNPDSILTYSDYAKSQGKVYSKIGFKFFGYAGLTALYAPLNKEGIAYKTQRASREYNKYGKEFNSCKEYFNSKHWYRINDAGNKIWIWKNSSCNSEN